MSYKNISLDTLKNSFGVVVKHLPLQLPMSDFVPSKQLEDEISEARFIPHLSEKDMIS